MIIETLEEHGYEAYAVGGCVRDSIPGKVPADWDITTSAKPEQVKRLFKCTIDTEIIHRTVTVLLHHVGYEVTTYRIDGEYEGIGHCALGYAAEPARDPAPRKEDFVYFI